MKFEKTISDHYGHGRLLEAIEATLPVLGKTKETLTIEDLAPVDEFHIGGRFATERIARKLGFSGKDHVLDVGCGLGGAARYVASVCGSRVTGIDLTNEYVETGNALNQWLELVESVKLEQGSALTMPFENGCFDGGYMFHVGMNIEDKTALFSEIYRVLKPEAKFAVYDVMRLADGAVKYPVPWAAESNASKLSSPAQYKSALIEAGFRVVEENERRQFALDFFREAREKNEAAGGPPPLSLHVLMQEGTTKKLSNLVENIKAGIIAPVEIIATV